MYNVFSSDIVSIQVGQYQKLFRLHIDVLSQSAILHAEAQEHAEDDALVIQDTTPSKFDLVVRYLYGAAFEDLLLPDSNSQDGEHLQSLCELLCFSLNYGLSELSDIIICHIQKTSPINYQAILAAAQNVCNTTKQTEPRFREFVLGETKKALTNSDVANQSWLASIFEHGHNGLSRDIFECYRSVHQVFTRNLHTPSSDTTTTDDEVTQSEAYGRESQHETRKVKEVVSFIENKTIDDELGHAYMSSQNSTEPGESQAVSSNVLDRQQPRDCADSKQHADMARLSLHQNLSSTSESLCEAFAPDMHGSDTCSAELGAAELGEVDPCEPEPLPLDIEARYIANNCCLNREWHLSKMSRWGECTSCRKEVFARVEMNVAEGFKVCFCDPCWPKIVGY